MAVMGIYEILNRENGKFYIGSSVNIPKRWKRHLNELNNGCHGNDHLQRAWNKYGPEAFDFSIIEKVDKRATLLDREQHWLDHTKSYEYEIGYNICPQAHSPNPGYSPRKGVKVSKETKKKQSEAKLGKRSAYASLTDEQVIEIKTRLRDGEKQSHIADSMGVTRNIVNRIHKGKTYTDIII
jgi:group I intron endonuclease